MNGDVMSARGIFGGSVLTLVVLLATPTLTVGAEDVTRLFMTVNRSRVLSLRENVTKVSVTNPAVVDITVLSPQELLVNAKAVGQTSLLLFHGRSIKHYDLMVHTAPVSATAPLNNESAQYHSVLVQRADKVTSQIFVRSDDSSWVELGTVAPATEARK
jgi:Flp pilus assembly secretin CpaC